jgi:hypothetical protein
MVLKRPQVIAGAAEVSNTGSVLTGNGADAYAGIRCAIDKVSFFVRVCAHKALLHIFYFQETFLLTVLPPYVG